MKALLVLVGVLLALWGAIEWASYADAQKQREAAMAVAQSPVATPAPEVPVIVEPPPVAAPGIGVGQMQIRKKMEGLGYTFSPGAGQVMGKNASGTAYCQLLGDARDLESAGMMLTMKTEEESEMLGNLAAVAIFIQLAVPGWPEGAAWVMKALAGKKPRVELKRGPIQVIVDEQPSIGITTVSVRRAAGA